jgi:hypothetical protein
MKKNSSRKRKILYSVTAAALFVLLLVLFFPGDREYQRIPYDVVFLGDSVVPSQMVPCVIWKQGSSQSSVMVSGV